MMETRNDELHWLDEDRTCDGEWPDDDQDDEVKGSNEDVSDSNETPADDDDGKEQEIPQDKHRRFQKQNQHEVDQNCDN